MSTMALINSRSNGSLAELFVAHQPAGFGADSRTACDPACRSFNPRASRSINLVFALLTYMVYSNTVSIVQAWVASGKLGFGTGWLDRACRHAVAASVPVLAPPARGLGAGRR